MWSTCDDLWWLTVPSVGVVRVTWVISTFGLTKFRHSNSTVYWCDQQTRRRSACGLHLRRSSASWLNAQVYYTLVDCNPLTPLLRFVLDLSYKLFLHCFLQLLARFWLTHRVARSLCDSWASYIPLRGYLKHMPSVLWRCWLGGRKGIRPVKNWAVGCRRVYLSGARCRLAYGPADATATHCLLLQ